MVKLLVIGGIIVFIGLVGLTVFCFAMARKAEDERLEEKRAMEEQAILDTPLEDLVDKELEERYKATPQTAGKK